MDEIAAAAAYPAAMTAARVTRLAPTPSGALHIGNARTFLVNWALARNNGWRIVMRLEDLDFGRVRPGAHQSALDDLSALGIDWDGEPEVQSRNLTPYRDALEQLVRDGRVFRCDRSRGDIRNAASAPHADDAQTRFPPELRPAEPWPRVISAWDANHRLRVDPAQERVDDEFLASTHFDPGAEAGDLVVWTKLGVPAYQLAVVVDDARHHVTDVVRGDDLLASAARQQLIARALGVGHARWWHVPLVYGDHGTQMGTQMGKRLAKRHGAHSLAQLRADGVTAQRVIGWCAQSLGLVESQREISARDFLKLATETALREACARVAAAPTIFKPTDFESSGRSE